LERRPAIFVSRCYPYLSRCKYAANTVTAYRRQCDASPGWTSTPMNTPMLSHPGEAQTINTEHRDHHLLKGLDTPEAAPGLVTKRQAEGAGWCPFGVPLRTLVGGWWLCGCWGLTGVRVGSEDLRVDVDAVTAIVSAVSAGAGAGLKDTTAKAVTDAYGALKRLIIDQYRLDVGPLEQKPDSRSKRESLAEDLAAVGAGGDAELVAVARRVIDAVCEHDPEVGSVIGVDLVGLRAANVRLSDIEVDGSGVRGRDWTVSGDVEISRVRAGRPPQPPDPR
jgi:hypothetical protein